ncbi:hypothetical protein [Sulfurimonas sp.]|uniref:hypothetical protein n=1 Tax=Sulfurimonas sp. TaxID=2022749 RepID=UPI003D14320F
MKSKEKKVAADCNNCSSIIIYNGVTYCKLRLKNEKVLVSSGIIGKVFDCGWFKKSKPP